MVLALLAVLSPWLFFLGLTILFPPDNDESPTSTSSKPTPIRSLCTSRNCVRCTKNKQEFTKGQNRFKDRYHDDTSLQRIQEALTQSTSESEKIFLRVKFPAERPLWEEDQLSRSICRDIDKLENAWRMIAAECQEALSVPHLWRRNEEPSSTWFTFSLVNQGAWQEAQCRICEKLTTLLHGLDALIVDCLFGNVFISMLPGNSTISEHRGLTNARLRCHLGVEVPKDPERCYMMVGGEKFSWTEGRCVVFDDSFPHSVSSRGCKADRIVLVLDFWHPSLAKAERQCLSRIFPSMYD